MSGSIKGWLHLLNRSNAAAQTSAGLALNQRISAEVTLAQATDNASKKNASVQRSAGQVRKQYEIITLEHARLEQEEEALKAKVVFLVGRYQQQTAAGDITGASTTKNQGASIATALTSKQNELHANEALMANLAEAVKTADAASDSSEQQFQDAENESARLKSLQVQASLAKATTAAISGLTTPDADDTTATMADARSKIEGDYAEAIGMQQVVSRSAAAEAISLDVEMHQAAGASLFDEAVAKASAPPPLQDSAGKPA